MKKVRIINKSDNKLPKYETPMSAGLDLAAYISNQGSITIAPGERKLIPTGLYIALPQGCEAQIRPRSGLALKRGVTVLNSPGTIDADYRGEIGVLLINLGQEPFEIKSGDRIAQMVIAQYEQVEFELTEKLDETERGDGGFGHTDVQECIRYAVMSASKCEKMPDNRTARYLNMSILRDAIQEMKAKGFEIDREYLKKAILEITYGNSAEAVGEMDAIVQACVDFETKEDFLEHMRFLRLAKEAPNGEA